MFALETTKAKEINGGIVDAHHHLWDPNAHDFFWMTGEAAPLARPYGLDELEAAIRSLPVTATVVVQAVMEKSETFELLNIAEHSKGLIGGVVGWVDVRASDIVDEIDELRAAPGGGLLKAIRHQAQDEADPNWLGRSDVVKGIRAIHNCGLAYDLLVRAPQRRAAIALAKQADSGRLILDHGGKPRIKDGEFEQWRSDIAELASFGHVSCKVSGLFTEAGEAWTVNQLRPYIHTIVDLFGPHRCIFGSDWPVCTLVASYVDVYNTVRGILGELLSPTEIARVMCGTSVEVYALDSKIT